MIGKTFVDPAFCRDWNSYRRKKEQEFSTILDEERSHTKALDTYHRLQRRKQEMYAAMSSGVGLGNFGLGMGGLDDYYTDPHYSSNLVAQLVTASYMLDGKEKPDGKIVEIGFGKKLNDMHLPLLAKLGYETLGLEIDVEAVEIARRSGYNAQLVRDFDDIPEVLDGQNIKYMIACRVFEVAPLILGKDSEPESPEQLFAMMRKVNKSLQSGHLDDSLPQQRMTEREALDKTRDFFRGVHDVTLLGCTHVYTTTEPFIPPQADLKSFGYDIIGVNADNHEFTQARRLTVFKS